MSRNGNGLGYSRDHATGSAGHGGYEAPRQTKKRADQANASIRSSTTPRSSTEDILQKPKGRKDESLSTSEKHQRPASNGSKKLDQSYGAQRNLKTYGDHKKQIVSLKPDRINSKKRSPSPTIAAPPSKRSKLEERQDDDDEFLYKFPQGRDQSERMSSIPKDTESIVSSFMDRILGLQIGSSKTKRPRERDIKEFVISYLRSKLQIGNRTNLGTVINDLDGILAGVLSHIKWASIWAISPDAASIPRSLIQPMNVLFNVGTCFWARHVEYAMDSALALGDDGAPAPGGKTCNKERFHIVVQVFASYLLTATTGTHQGKDIADVAHIPVKERPHYFEVIDSKDVGGHVRRPGAHAPLLVDTFDMRPLGKGATVNAAIANHCIPCDGWTFAGILEPVSNAQLSKAGAYLRRPKQSLVEIPEGSINWAALKDSMPDTTASKAEAEAATPKTNAARDPTATADTSNIAPKHSRKNSRRSVSSSPSTTSSTVSETKNSAQIVSVNLNNGSLEVRVGDRTRPAKPQKFTRTKSNPGYSYGGPPPKEGPPLNYDG